MEIGGGEHIGARRFATRFLRERKADGGKTHTAELRDDRVKSAEKKRLMREGKSRTAEEGQWNLSEL